MFVFWLLLMENFAFYINFVALFRQTLFDIKMLFEAPVLTAENSHNKKRSKSSRNLTLATFNVKDLSKMLEKSKYL